MRRFLLLAVIAISTAVPLLAQRNAIVYRVTIPEPEHHWLQVEATYPAVGSKPLNLQMSKSSPGRYSIHDFAKNVFWLSATDGKGRTLAVTRPSPSEWNVAG